MYAVVDQDDEKNEKIKKPTTPVPISDEGGKTPTTNKHRCRKEKPSKMQVAFENAIKEHNTCMQESDKKFLSEIREQAEKERELRKGELGALKIPWHYLQVLLLEEHNQ